MLNKSAANTTQEVWKLAMGEQLAFMEKLTCSGNKFHVIVLAHLKMISPKDMQKDDSDLTKEIKQQVADLIPARLFPRALGRELPQAIGGEFPTLLLMEPKYVGREVRRIITFVPRPELDLALPAKIGKDFPTELDIS